MEWNVTLVSRLDSPAQILLIANVQPSGLQIEIVWYDMRVATVQYRQRAAATDAKAKAPYWVGARLAAGLPPGTVRAPLGAYGSTSETAERHIFQRGEGMVFPVPIAQLG